MLTPSAPTIVRLLAPARISMPSRVRVTSDVEQQRDREPDQDDDAAVGRDSGTPGTSSTWPASAGGTVV